MSHDPIVPPSAAVTPVDAAVSVDTETTTESPLDAKPEGVGATPDDDAQEVEHDPKSREGIRAQIIDNIKMVYDPEIPVDLYALGLIYGVDVAEDRTVKIDMTLTSPMCPTAQSLVGQVEMAARDVPFVVDAEVALVWDPPWDMDKMSEEARLLLGF